jgi:hypothetical protein
VIPEYDTPFQAQGRLALEQAVVIRFPLSDCNFGTAWELEVLSGLADDIAEVVAASESGEYDGYEVGEGEYLLFLYGLDADELFEVLEPLLCSQAWPGAVTAVKRYGPPGAPEAQVTVGDNS